MVRSVDNPKRIMIWNPRVAKRLSYLETKMESFKLAMNSRFEALESKFSPRIDPIDARHFVQKILSISWVWRSGSWKLFLNWCVIVICLYYVCMIIPIVSEGQNFHCPHQYLNSSRLRYERQNRKLEKKQNSVIKISCFSYR